MLRRRRILFGRCSLLWRSPFTWMLITEDDGRRCRLLLVTQGKERWWWCMEERDLSRLCSLRMWWSVAAKVLMMFLFFSCCTLLGLILWQIQRSALKIYEGRRSCLLWVLGCQGILLLRMWGCEFQPSRTGGECKQYRKSTYILVNNEKNNKDCMQVNLVLPAGLWSHYGTLLWLRSTVQLLIVKLCVHYLSLAAGMCSYYGTSKWLSTVQLLSVMLRIAPIASCEVGTIRYKLQVANNTKSLWVTR